MASHQPLTPSNRRDTLEERVEALERRLRLRGIPLPSENGSNAVEAGDGVTPGYEARLAEGGGSEPGGAGGAGGKVSWPLIGGPEGGGAVPVKPRRMRPRRAKRPKDPFFIMVCALEG